MGRFEEAKLALEKSLAIQSSQRAKVFLGLSHLLTGNTSEAILILRGAAAEHPDLYSMTTLGVRWTGDSEGAKAAFTRAIAAANRKIEEPAEMGQLALANAQIGLIPVADALISRATNGRSEIETDLLYDAAIVDACAGRDKEFANKCRLLVARHFPMPLITHDPFLARVLVGTGG